MLKETETLEFKKSLTQLKEGIISVVSMLNKHQRGKIVFGVKDDGIPVGVSIGKIKLFEPTTTFEELRNFFITTFSRKNIINQRLKSSEKSSEKVLFLIKEIPWISAKDIASEINLSSRGVEKILAQLKREGIIVRQGSPKKGFWKIVK